MSPRIFILLTLLFGSQFLIAQQLSLPAKSPAATASRTLGYANIEVSYSSPAVRGREIWGNVVPYDTLWRAGANKATRLCFSEKVEVEGKAVAAGCYALFFLPRETGEWEAVLNVDTSLWGTNGYDPAKDVLRVPVEAKFARTASEEFLKYEIVPQNIENAYLMLSWEKLRVYLRLRTKTMEQAVKQIQQAVAVTPDDKKWKVYLESADFLLWVDKPGPALQYAQQSLEAKPTPPAHWIAAQAHAAMGEEPKAVEAAKRAKMLSATKEKGQGYYGRHRAEIEQRMSQWEE